MVGGVKVAQVLDRTLVSGDDLRVFRSLPQSLENQSRAMCSFFIVFKFYFMCINVLCVHMSVYHMRVSDPGTVVFWYLELNQNTLKIKYSSLNNPFPHAMCSCVLG